jgi:hypothetical protein
LAALTGQPYVIYFCNNRNNCHEEIVFGGRALILHGGNVGDEAGWDDRIQNQRLPPIGRERVPARPFAALPIANATGLMTDRDSC